MKDLSAPLLCQSARAQWPDLTHFRRISSGISRHAYAARVLALHRHLGRAVVTADGDWLGRLDDIVVTDLARPTATALLVRPARQGRQSRQSHQSGEGRQSLRVDWDLVADFTVREVTLKAHPPAESTDAPRDQEFLLRRDLLDTQVIDVVGRRVARVSDVLLHRESGSAPVVTAVDVGLGVVLQRLGLRRLGRTVAPQVIAWSDLHMTSDRGHEVQLRSTDAVVHRLDAAALHELLAAVRSTDAADIIEVFAHRAAELPPAPTARAHLPGATHSPGHRRRFGAVRRRGRR
ncbi:MAG TPA: hypothetical protein DHW34_04405 [Actinobacteria bacterium]|nr:hypothetical protein [Actinomycetota bacterium]HCK79239.1 hypothetical protein [Actinomycetota bacterium]